MKPLVESAIIGASFNDSGFRKKADAKSIAGAQKYIDRGSRCVSHIIYRSYGENQDNKKHIYCIGGVPVLVYVLRNASNSDLEDIAVVGDMEIKSVVETHNEVFGENKIHWIDEGSKEKLSLSNTLKRGTVKGKKQLFIPGDLPFFIDINSVIYDKDIDNYDIIADLNTKENTCEPVEGFLRNWYFALRDGEKLHHAKEPNLVVADFSKSIQMWNVLYGTRKAGGLVTRVMREAMKPEKLWRMAPYVFAKELPYFIAFVLRKLKLTKYDPGFNFSSLNAIATPFMESKALIKMEHKSLGRVMDMDSHEDNEFIEHVVDEEGLEKVYPYAGDIEHFRKEGMPLLKQRIKMFEIGYENYINDRRASVNMQPLFDMDGKLIKQVDTEYRKRVENCRLILEKDKKRFK